MQNKQSVRGRRFHFLQLNGNAHGWNQCAPALFGGTAYHTAPVCRLFLRNGFAASMCRVLGNDRMNSGYAELRRFLQRKIHTAAFGAAQKKFDTDIRLTQDFAGFFANNTNNATVDCINPAQVLASFIVKKPQPSA